MVGVPYHPKENLAFNAHRVYGPVQLPHLFANWEQVHLELDRPKMEELESCDWCYQPLFVVRKPPTSSTSEGQP